MSSTQTEKPHEGGSTKSSAKDKELQDYSDPEFADPGVPGTSAPLQESQKPQQGQTSTGIMVEVMSEYSDSDENSDDPLTSSRSEGGLGPNTSTPERTSQQKPKSDSSLLRIRAQIRAAARANIETSIRQAKEPTEQEVADISMLSDRSVVGGGDLHEMPRLANKLLQHTKAKLEESRNLKQEIREAVCSGVHGLYEMILRLADSRNRHIAEKEKARANYEHQLARLEARHSAALDSLLRSHHEAQQKLLEEVKAAHKEAESTRWLTYEVEAHGKEHTKMLERLATKVDSRSEPMQAGAAPASEQDKQAATQIFSQELRRVQEDIATLRLEIGTLNMTLDASTRQISGTAPSTTQPTSRRARQEGGLDLSKETPPKTYADALATPKFGIMLESVEPRHTSEDVLKQLKGSVDLIEMGIGVNKVTKISKQRVIINCDSAADREVLLHTIKEKNKSLTVAQTRPKNPLLRLVGVTADLKDAKIEEAVLNQNRSHLVELSEEEKKVKVVRRIRGRSSALNNVILETSPILWQRLQGKKLRIGYQMVDALDQTPLIQCYNCLGFGHRARDCDKDTKCGHCAGPHDTRKCSVRNLPPRCTNCTALNLENSHPAYSSACPEWRRRDRLARAAVSYC